MKDRFGEEIPEDAELIREVCSRLRCHGHEGKQTHVVMRKDDPKQVDFAVPTPNAWWCTCGEPRYGGIAPIAPREATARALREIIGIPRKAFS